MLAIRRSELDAHADDPERISPRTLNRLRADYERPGDFTSTNFGPEYRERVKARILGGKEEEPLPLTTNTLYWRPARIA